jgi:hypothetical protein
VANTIKKKNMTLTVTIGILSLLGLTFALLRTYLAINGMQTGILPEVDDINYGYALHPWVTLLHAVPGAIFMITGPMQFIEGLRKRSPVIHKSSGYLFILSSITLGISGLSIAIFFPFGGTGETVTSIIFGGLFLASIIYGLYLAIQKQFLKHKHWMMRAFSLGLGIVTIRFIGPLTEIFLPEGASADLVFTSAMSIGWLLHLAVAEYLIRRKKSNVRKPTSALSAA